MGIEHNEKPRKERPTSKSNLWIKINDMSPAVLGETIKHHVSQFQNEFPEVVKVLNRLYCDDLSFGSNNANEAFEIYAKAKEIMLAGGFNLRKWNSNDKILLNQIEMHENKVSQRNTVSETLVETAEDDHSYSKHVIASDGHYEIVSTHDTLSRRARYNRKVLSQFTARWRNEYLSSLLAAFRPKDKAREPVVAVGDIVILKDEQRKRCFWKMCKVLELFKGNDGSIRAAKVQVASQEGGKRVLNRALKLLIPLEINCSLPLSKSYDNENDAPPQPSHATSQRANARTDSRPKRNAAAIGELLRRDIL
eukprot:gene15551-biopygen13262